MSKGFGSNVSKVEVIDNFLSPLDFDILKKDIFSERFPWFFAEESVIGGGGPSQLAHVLYGNNKPQTPAIDFFEPFLQKLSVVSLIRMKINMTLPLQDPELPYCFHHDLGSPNDPKMERTKPLRTGIYYFNSTNGPTYVGEEKIECVENRFISFPHNIEHTGTSFTNDKRRVVLNVNYLP
jgi:hypothetical protein